MGLYPGWISHHTKQPVRKVATGYTGLAGRYTGFGPVNGRILRMGNISARPNMTRLYGENGGFTRGYGG